MHAHRLRQLCTVVSGNKGAKAHAALAHSSWFRVRDQGMVDHEVLAQGSAFLTRASGGRLFALLSAHVAAPHRWRRYFSAEFLDFVKDEHCESHVEQRSVGGKDILKSFLVSPLSAGFAESQRDVAAFHVPDSDGAPVLQLADGPIPPNAAVEVHGHVLRGVDGADGVIPTVVRGEIIATDGPRAFFDTGSEECEIGMCGGPVIMENGVCAGILEGVVPRLKVGEEPLSDLHAKIAGSAALISAYELRLFLADVEKTIQRIQLDAEGSVSRNTSD